MVKLFFSTSPFPPEKYTENLPEYMTLSVSELNAPECRADILNASQ
jgi:hypothetical protein